MSFSYTTSPNSYLTDRYNFILLMEENGNPNLKPYPDSKGLVTIGIGFNLHDKGMRQKVLDAMKITNPALLTQLGSYMDKIYVGVATDKIQKDLDGIMQKYIPPSSDGTKATFGFADSAPVKELFNGANGNDGLAQDYENLVDKWAAKYDLGTIPQSHERIVLLSLAYNSQDKNKDGIPDLLGNGLGTAMASGNRAEAWYQIRYQSNADKIQAARRFYEGDYFGLYGDPVNPTAKEKQDVYDLITSNRSRYYEKILTYENQYKSALVIKGDLPTTGQPAQPLSKHLLTAGQLFVDHFAKAELDAAGVPMDITFDGGVWVGSVTNDGGLKSIKATAGTHNDLLVAFDDEASSLHGNEGDDLLVGSGQADKLYGGSGNDIMLGKGGDDYMSGWDGDDVLVGGSGNDELKGGGGADKLYGGAGDDTIHFEGNDTYSDTVIDGGSGTDTLKGTKGSDNLDMTKLTMQNVEKIDLAGGNDTLVMHSTGDLAGVDSIDGGAGNDTVQGTDQGDTIDLSAINATGFEAIHGGKGVDHLTATNAGMYLYGDGGGDYLYGGTGNDTLNGGVDADHMYGGGGYDTYFATNGDVISDSDGSGRVFLFGLLTDGYEKKAGSGIYYDDRGGKYTNRGRS